MTDIPTDILLAAVVIVGFVWCVWSRVLDVLEGNREDEWNDLDWDRPSTMEARMEYRRDADRRVLDEIEREQDR